MRFAIKTRPQHTTWQRLRDVWVAADDIEVFESIWNWDHFYPLSGDLAGPNFEAWTMLAAMAPLTRRIRLGCQVAGMIYRHPAVLANMAATIDVISDGRLELGIGAGWNQVECDAYGIELPPMRERFDRFDEGVQAIIALLTEPVANFPGRYVTLTDAYCEPKAVQRPHPPIVIGGRGPSAPCAPRPCGRSSGTASSRIPEDLARPEGDPARALHRRRPRPGRDHLLGQCPVGAGGDLAPPSRRRPRTARPASTW